MDREIAVFGEREYKLNCIDYIYLGTVGDFLSMSDKSWDEMRQSILINFGAVWCRSADHQYSKLALVDKIGRKFRNNPGLS